MALTTFTGPVVSQNGFLDSSFTTAERDAIVDPQAGLLIYNTTVNEYQVYSGTAWDTAFGGGVPGYTLGVDFFNPEGYVSQWSDVSVDLYNVVPALKAELDALVVGDTFLLNGSVEATVVLNNGESTFGDPPVRDYWINASPGRGPGGELAITSISFG